MIGAMKKKRIERLEEYVKDQGSRIVELEADLKRVETVSVQAQLSLHSCQIEKSLLFQALKDSQRIRLELERRVK